MKPIISIVTPSYNQGRYIEDTIKSILKQKGDFYTDYIIQDGLSNDNSVNVIKKYEAILRNKCDVKKYKNINFYTNKKGEKPIIHCNGISYRWVSKRDKGQVDAIKKGFKVSVGQILNWLNSDDIFVGDKVFSKIIGYFNLDQKLKIVTGDGIQINEQGEKIGEIKVKNINIKENIFLDYHILQPSTFIKKEIYNPIYLMDKYRVAFDAEYFIRLFSQGYKYKKTDDVFSAYRFYPEIKTLSLSGIRFWDQFFITLTYSKNPIYILIAFIYHYFEIILSRKTNNGLFHTFFAKLRKFSYLVITGNKERI